MTLVCSNCPYNYREYDYERKMFSDEYPRCHFESMFEGDLAPCEYEEEDSLEDDMDNYL